MHRKLWTATLSVCVLALFASSGTFAAGTTALDESTSTVLRQFYGQNSMNEELAKKAAGMLVFPHVVKGGVGVSGEYGRGVLLIKGRPVRRYVVQGGSVGLTIGAGQHSEVIMFMTHSALAKFTKSNGWTVGAQTGIAVVSKGAGGEYDSETLKKPVLGFVFGETGLIGDVSLAGLKISKLKVKS